MKHKLILLILLFCTASSMAQQVVLFIRNSAKVSSTDVLLRDLVTNETSIPSQWKTRRVFSAPPSGETRYYSLTAVAKALNEYNDMQQVILRGEPVISIQREEREIDADELEKPLMDYLAATPPWAGLDLQVKVLGIPDKLKIPAGETSYTVTKIEQQTTQGYSLAHIQVKVDAIPIKEIVIEIEIQFLTDVWVVTQNLSPGHTLELSDLRNEKRVIDSTSGFVSSSENMEGYEVTRVMQAGDLLRRNSISKPVCVHRGEWVAINAFGSNLHITLRGKALANGRLGDRILCMNESSMRQVLVELVGVGNAVLIRM